jgi:hypothetical protein
VPPGEASGSGGGDIGYICEVRREPAVEFWRESGAVIEFWRESEPDAGCVLDGLLVTLGRGESGTELRSGAMIDRQFPLCFCFDLQVHAWFWSRDVEVESPW